MDESRNQVRSDASKILLTDSSKENINLDLDLITNDLSEDDYISILFLLLRDEDSDILNYLYFIKQGKDKMRNEFYENYHKHPNKDSMLVEVLGIMQKYKLLTLLKTCQHYFKKGVVEDTNILDWFWKCLYSICEQLSDAQVMDLKQRFNIPASLPITCAEQLFCEALKLHKFNRNDLSLLEEIFQQHYPKCYEILMTYKRSSKLSYYPMTLPTTGCAVIFSHTHFKSEKGLPLPSRLGSLKDADDLKAVWEKFGFKAEIHCDKTDIEVESIFTKLSKSDHSSHNAFVACYLSHGDEGVVYASNCKPVSISWMVSTMANKCLSLIGKPKLFFIQACQGNQVLNDVLNYSKKEPSEKIQIDLRMSKSCEDTPMYSDVLLVLSTIEKFASYSCPKTNSWFIGELVKVLNEDGEHLTIFSIITKVIEQVSQKEGIEQESRQRCKQIPVFNSTLRYELKFKRR